MDRFEPPSWTETRPREARSAKGIREITVIISGSKEDDGRPKLAKSAGRATTLNRTPIVIPIPATIAAWLKISFNT